MTVDVSSVGYTFIIHSGMFYKHTDTHRYLCIYVNAYFNYLSRVIFPVPITYLQLSSIVFKV